MAKKKKSDRNVVAQNRKARYEYEILEEYDAGIALLGSEVKSLRTGQANITDSYVDPVDGELFLLNAHIPEYKQARQFNHKPNRPRKLLLHKNEIKKLTGKVTTKGLTVIPLEIYFNDDGFAKVKIALGKGKTKYDKREAESKRDWQRQKARALREG